MQNSELVNYLVSTAIEAASEWLSLKSYSVYSVSRQTGLPICD